MQISELAREASHFELSTWAGVINLFGVAALGQGKVMLDLIDRAGYWMRTMLNDFLVYRARMRGLTITPAPLRANPMTPKPLNGGQQAAWMIVYVVICVTVIAIVAHVG